MSVTAEDLTLNLVADVLEVQFLGKSQKIKLPRGERGPAGRDGINIRGDKGEPGRDGVPGRDSSVPGPRGDKGDKGDAGDRGKCPVITIGKVEAGDEAKAYIHGDPENPILDLVLPRGVAGATGRPGAPGRHGSHEFIEPLSLGHSPRFNEEWFAHYIIADGIIDIPEVTESDVGRWFHIKSFDRVVVNGAVEGQIGVEKGESAKFVVIPYCGKYLFTRF